MKNVIYQCIANILERENKTYASLNEIYEEVSVYLETENNYALQSQIRGRLQECCEQYSSFLGEPLFLTEKPRSGKWTIKKKEKKFIRYEHNYFLISEDNWRTIEKVRSITEEYTLETVSENVYRAKLTFLLGREKATILIDELNMIRTLLAPYPTSSKKNEGYGMAFEIFSISVLHHIDYEECIHHYKVHGDADGKIDVIYFKDTDTVYIYQIKMDTIGDNAYSEMALSYESCIKGKVPEHGKDLFAFYKKNETALEGKVVVYRSVSMNSSKTTNFKPTDIYDMFFENRLLPQNNNNLTLNIIKPSLPIDDTLQYNVSTDGKGNFNFYIQAEKLIQYILESLGIKRANPVHLDDISRYFTDNVRGVLSVNEKMIKTIREEPENFIKYNNGINITGEVADLGHIIRIKNPVINNGQQTITTLISTNMNLDQITVSVKVTNECDPIIKGKISQYSNEQVKVKAIDMLSLNSYVRKIQDVIFKKEYNGKHYFLEIYSSGKKSYYDLLKKLYQEKYVIGLLDFMKLYYSLINNKDLGNWKNSPNSQIEKTVIDEDFDELKSFQVCEATVRYISFIETIENKKEKDDFKSADLAFKYLLCKENMSEEEAFFIIKNMNKKYYYDVADEKSKLIDIYKSTTIINLLEDEVKAFRKQKEVKE